MGVVSAGVSTILILGFSVFCFVAYHKIFDVLYFDATRGILKEIIGCLLCGAFLATIVIRLWWVAAIILAIIALSAYKKRKTGMAIFCVVLIILSAIVGINVSKTLKEEATVNVSYQVAQDYCPSENY